MGRKHCGKRRNCLLRAVSPFHIVFVSHGFQKVSLCGNGLMLYKQQKLSLVQIESINCRQKNKCDLKTENCFWKGIKLFWESRKCWSPAFFLLV